MAEDSSKPPILALYTECPSIPLLHTVNLRRLRALADKYDFLIVIDDTVGTFINVDLMSYADILVTSLSKFFSGYATALGGSLVLNPRMRHYAVLKAKFMSTYEDTYFDADAIVMEQNSRDFLDRMHIINSNAEYICDFLLSYSTGNAALQGGDRNAPVIKQVYYPKYISRENYDTCRRPPFTSQLHEKGGEYGGVFSLTFTSLAASRAFYDTLAVAKGPSFGTTFTLSCLYTLLNHYSDLEWAAKYGVDEGLVRVSVGTEDRGVLLRIMEAALRAAELAA
ncbi:hypothetical protein ID866_4911 [Astraeus odoratus]|nr:hypothetical protein ID866_4911 [Astraeus odoratus]